MEKTVVQSKEWDSKRKRIPPWSEDLTKGFTEGFSAFLGPDNIPIIICTFFLKLHWYGFYYSPCESPN